MAIEIVPKKEIKTKRRSGVLFILSIVVLALTVSLYFGLFWINREKQKEIDGLKSDLESLMTPELEDIEDRIMEQKTRIDDFASVFSNRKSPKEVLKFFEEKTHKRVMWSGLSLDLSDPTVVLDGTCDNFITLAEQIIVFKGAKSSVAKVTLLELALGESQVDFSLELILNPQLFNLRP